MGLGSGFSPTLFPSRSYDVPGKTHRGKDESERTRTRRELCDSLVPQRCKTKTVS